MRGFASFLKGNSVLTATATLLPKPDPGALLRKYTASVPVNVEAAIAESGVILDKNATLPEGIIGALARLQDGRYEIRVASGQSEDRKRLIMAHELGHYIFHRSLVGAGVDDDEHFRSTDRGPFFNTDIDPFHEAQANSFAAALLMPPERVKEAIDELRDKGGDEPSVLAERFAVPVAPMRWRLRRMGRLHDNAPHPAVGPSM